MDGVEVADEGNVKAAAVEVGDGEGVLFLEIFRILSLGVLRRPGSGVEDDDR